MPSALTDPPPVWLSVARWLRRLVLSLLPARPVHVPAYWPEDTGQGPLGAQEIQAPSVARLSSVPPPAPDPLEDLAGPHDDPSPVLGHCNARWGVVHRCCRPDLHQPKAGVLEHLCGCGTTVVE
jgi:hypothetical protein